MEGAGPNLSLGTCGRTVCLTALGGNWNLVGYKGVIERGTASLRGHPSLSLVYSTEHGIPHLVMVSLVKAQSSGSINKEKPAPHNL